MSRTGITFRIFAASPIAAVLLTSVALAADDRITASPTLPKTLSERRGETPAPAGATLILSAGQVIYSRDGRAAARIAKVVRDKEGRPMRVILTTPDEIRRYTPVADIYASRGRAQMRLTREQILALPRVETE